MSKAKKILKWVLFVLLFVILMCKLLWINFWRVPQNGMYPTLPASKRFLCKRHPYKSVSDVKRGDIVIFKVEGEDKKRYDFVWRVMGLPGDSITIQDRKVIIDGNDLKLERIREEGKYIIYKETNKSATYEVAYLRERDSKDSKPFQYNIPENHIFVLGDNRDEANDSRYMGTIPFDSIIAKKL